MISKNYANLTQGQTHYRRAGTGLPLIVLHASPMSSEFMVPLIETLCDVVDVVAPDTPGYGNSDALPAALIESTDDLQPYVEWLADFIDKLGFNAVGVYGTATGAQIAIEFARAFPGKTDFVVLDNAAHFSERERADMLPKYFPEITPQLDGGHLKQVWEMAGGLFQWFPWYAQDEQHRVSDDSPSAHLIHATALAYLTAGADYAQAYRRAFANEDAKRVVEITVPVCVIRWQGSILKTYADRYDEFVWPDYVQMRHCGPGIDERYQAIREAVIELARVE